MEYKGKTQNQNKMEKQTRAQKLGVTEFPYIEKDENGRVIYWEYANGQWERRGYDEDGDRYYYINSNERKEGKPKENPEETSFLTITNSIADLLSYKNDKYGDAALNPLGIFSGKCKAGTRIDDKLSRIKNGSELRKNDVADLIGYLILVCKEKGWNDFSEFKD